MDMVMDDWHDQELHVGFVIADEVVKGLLSIAFAPASWHALLSVNIAHSFCYIRLASYQNYLFSLPSMSASSLS